MPEVYHYMAPDTTGAELSEYFRHQRGRPPEPGDTLVVNTQPSRLKRDLVTLEYDDVEDDQWNFTDPVE